MSDNNQTNKHAKHFEKKFPWDGEVADESEEIEQVLNDNPELNPRAETLDPIEAEAEQYEFRPPKINANLAFLGLAIAGVIAGIIAIFKLSGSEDNSNKPKTKPKPKPKTVTKTITKVRPPTEAEMKDWAAKQKKKDKIIEETEETTEEEK